MMKYRDLERVVKGFSNHRRIQILELLQREPELSLMEIAESLSINFKTAGEHTRRLVHASLVMKRNDFHAVRHALTKQGLYVLKFLRTLE